MAALLDLLPLIAFFIAAKQYGLIAGAVAVMAATVAVGGIHMVRQGGRLTRQQWTVLVLTVVFCSATLLLRDDVYLRWKTPVINLCFALAMAASVLAGKPLLRVLAGEVLDLGERGWKRLTWLWAAFFLLLAGIHYWIGLYAYDASSEDSKNLFINFKTYGQLVLMVVFLAVQVWALRKYVRLPEENR